MKPIKTIASTNSLRISLGLHADLQTRLYAEISKVPVEKILLEAADMTNWKQSIDTESDVSRRIMASEQTAKLAEKDHERDKLLTAIFEEIRQAAKSPIPERAEAARKLLIVANTYKGLQWETVAEETAHITGLLTDLAKLPTDVNTLGLQPLITLLQTANTAFSDLRTTRAQNKAADTLPTGAAIRARNEEAKNAIFHHIEAAYMMADNDNDRKLVSELIDRLNRIIAETKTTYNESMAQKHAAAKNKNGKGKSEHSGTSKNNAGKTEAGKTEAGKTEAGKTEGGNTESGKTEGGKTENGKTESGKTDGREPELPTTLEGIRAMLAPMIPDFETDLGLPHGVLSFTGSFFGEGKARRYEFAAIGLTTKVWAIIKDGKLERAEDPKTPK